MTVRNVYHGILDPNFVLLIKVEDQSLFYIDECIDHRVSKEKANRGVISLLSEDASAKQIELKFTNLVGMDVYWRWNTRPITEKKFVMRFPSKKVVKEWSYFKTLTMRSVEAHINIEPWSPAGGIKGKLQQSWFRVTNIPADQRSVKTLAKVGGWLVKLWKLMKGLDLGLIM